VQDKAVQDRIAEAVEKQRAAYGGQTPVPGVLIGVWDGGGGAYVHAFGSADLARKQPMAADDHFRVGSNTKTFVVSVLLQLVDEGLLGLDDPLSRFDLGVTVPDADKITIRQLCQMRSGLFEAYDSPGIAQSDIKPDWKFDPRKLIALAANEKPYFLPGKVYRYSKHQLSAARADHRERDEGNAGRANSQAADRTLPPDADLLSGDAGNA
jgi:D-alanyl-D-alanine carboxypeptidase